MRILSIICGALLAVWLGYGLHTNPRWTWSPGEGELPRDVVSMYMDVAYKQGNLEEATKLFYSPKTQDEVPSGEVLPENKAFEPKVIRVIAEGFNVVVHYSVDSAAKGTTEYVEIFSVKGGRIATRERIVRESAEQTAPSSDAAPQLAPASTNRE